MGGWAKQRMAWLRPQARREGELPQRGVSVMDMPVNKPKQPKPRVKGVPETVTTDPDYEPGKGVWYSV